MVLEAEAGAKWRRDNPAAAAQNDADLAEAGAKWHGRKSAEADAAWRQKISDAKSGPRSKAELDVMASIAKNILEDISADPKRSVRNDAAKAAARKRGRGEGGDGSGEDGSGKGDGGARDGRRSGRPDKRGRGK
ncbi:MAG: hypothetical protein J3K34DRAFT_527738 [Monoraphidium minutum]|nr:MAG: hypothetical protein J3K34DRAFT_527738 [Monoraphidium minutum]